MAWLNLLFVFVLLSCATSVPKAPSKPITVEEGDVAILTNRCNTYDAVSCGKLGYFYKHHRNLDKAVRFYHLACELGEAASCTNKESLMKYDTPFAKEVKSKIYQQQNRISACYRNAAGIGHIIIEFGVKEGGAFEGLTINPGTQTILDGNFYDCARNVLSIIKFPAPPKGPSQRFSFDFAIHTVTKE